MANHSLKLQADLKKKQLAVAANGCWGLVAAVLTFLIVAVSVYWLAA